MPGTYLILGAVNGLPPSTPLDRSESLYDRSLKPFLKVLYNYEHLCFAIYLSGILHEWLEKHHSEFVDALTDMTRRQQVELLGGGFFEPIFPLIPKPDRIGQIERLTTHIRKNYGRRPRGAWVPKGIWDQRLTGSFASGGIEYVFLPASHLPGDAAKRATNFVTEDQGKIVTVYPVMDDLVASFFVESPQSIVDGIKKRSQREWRGGVEWPVVSLLFEGSMYGEAENRGIDAAGWLREFFDLLAQNDDWLKVQIPAKVNRRVHPTERRSISTTTVGELLRGVAGYGDSKDPRVFKALLEDYPEASNLYAKMMYTHVLVNQIRGDRYRKQTAREELWKGQSHHAYWVNGDGGLYRSSYRKATYSALIKAEKFTREKGVFIPAVQRLDVDLDGHDEVIFQGNDINAYVKLRGGYLFELDYLPRDWNYLDTFMRRAEPFHNGEAEEAGYDRWYRGAFIDHLLAEEQGAEAFAAGRIDSIVQLPEREYEIEDFDKEHQRVDLVARVGSDDGMAELEINKRYAFSQRRIDLEYTFHTPSIEALEGRFAVEINLSFFSLEVSKLRLSLRQGRKRNEISPEMSTAEGVSDIRFDDKHNNVMITVASSEKCDVWSFPVHAFGLADQHVDEFYQSNCVVLSWPIESLGDKQLAISLRLDNSR